MKFKYTAFALLGASILGSCDLNEKFYSSVTPETFITTPENTYAIMSRPFTHWKWYLGNDRWYLQELTTDEMVCPTRGSDFYNNGEYIRLHEHTWTPTDRFIVNTYEGTTGGIARALEAYDDLSKVDYKTLGMTDADKADQLNQLNSIIAYYYMKGLDYFGGMPIYRSNNDPVKARSTAKETYNYIDADFEMGKYFYPPTEAKVQPMLEIVKKVWIDSYTQVAGQDFIKSVAPRQISLIGGYNMNSDGTITLGFADSGMKITLFNVDQLDVTKHDATRQYFHTIQHEYCHIINQRKPYSEEYGKITPSDYTANWYNIQLADANKKGFITPYSMLNDIEDFAEMTSGILSMSKTDWDAKVNAIPEEGRNIIRKKEEFVVSYFKSEWNIDLYKLQEVVENQMLSVLQ